MSAQEGAQDACERGEVPRGKPGGAGGLPGSIWPRTRSTGGVRQAAGEIEQAERREMEVRAYLRF